MNRRRRSQAVRLVRSCFCSLLALTGLFQPGGTLLAAGIKTDILTINGEVTARGSATGPIIVEVYNRPQLSPRPVYSALMSRPGPYEIRVRPGTYYLRAFVDENRNRIWDIGEPAGLYDGEPQTGMVRADASSNPAAQALTVLALASKKGINIEIDVLKK